MTLTLIALVIAIIWGVVWFFDLLFKSCMNYPYLWILEKSGLSVKPGRLCWFSRSFNRTFQRLGLWNPRYLRIWFNMGAAACLGIMVPGVLMLIWSVKATLEPETSKRDDRLLTPVLPGVNLPIGDTPYFVSTVLLTSIFHELGHGVAAARERVSISGCGVMILGVIPAAFVAIPQDKMLHCSPWQQIRIYSAGVWHNIVLASVAFAILWTLPGILSLCYVRGNGVIVTDIKENSPVLGPTGLVVGDEILSVNNCQVFDFESWYKCVLKTYKSPIGGFCIDAEMKRRYTWKHFEANDFSDCCSSEDGLSGFCFTLNGDGSTLTKCCLPARLVLSAHNEFWTRSCDLSDDCLGHPKKTTMECVKPNLDNVTRLVQIGRKNKDDMLYVGDFLGLYSSVTVSEYIPRPYPIPIQLPAIIEKTLQYMVALSGALAVLNAVPCFGLDGNWIVWSLVELIGTWLSLARTTKLYIYRVIVSLGTLLVVVAVIKGFKNILP